MSNEEIVRHIQEGIDVTGNMELLYQNNKGYIMRIAGKYSGMAEQEDLIHEGYFGLYTAAQKYDPAQGVLFLTYAGYWIQQSMVRYMESDGTIRRPVYQLQRMNQYRKLQNAFQVKQGRCPTDQEIAYYMELSSKQVKRLRKDISSYRVESLDVPIGGDENDLFLSDTISCDSNTEAHAIEGMAAVELKQSLWSAVDTLPESEAKVIRYRFEQNMTLQAAGEALGVSRSAARACEAAGLRKLRCKTQIKQIGEDYGYISSSAYKYGVERFRNTWTSSTEHEALRRLGLLWEDDRLP